MPKNKILVVGESCRDIFVYCDAARLCPDIPVPVLNVKKQIENPGMAANVFRNIKQFVNSCDILTNVGWENVTKTRYMHNDTNHMFIRVDTDHTIPRLDVKTVDYNYDIIVISDYNKGFLHNDDIAEICKNHPNVFLDTKKILGDWANDAKFIKINNYEFNQSKEFITPDLNKKIIHTDGSNGCYFYGSNFKVNKVDVKDSSGAGDSFMAGLVCKYYETEDIIQSILFANSCAEKVVQQRGVTL
ncbi:hypothetical protein EBU95_18535, partial [bacterium]|nr:hypothetical protein [bacterium]